MNGLKCRICLTVILVSFAFQRAFPQRASGDSLTQFSQPLVDLKTGVHYSVEGTFLYAPHLGTISGYTFSPYLSVPVSPRLSVEGGIIAGRYYSSLFTPESALRGSFNQLSLYGSASYHVNPQLTLYGIGIKQISGTSPFYALPKSSYTIGSSFNFGSFSIGASFQVSKWGNDFGPSMLNGAPGFYSQPFYPFPRY